MGDCKVSQHRLFAGCKTKAAPKQLLLRPGHKSEGYEGAGWKECAFVVGGAGGSEGERQGGAETQSKAGEGWLQLKTVCEVAFAGHCSL